MRKIFFTTILLFLALGQVWAGTETTVYYAVSSATVGSYTVKLNVNYKGDGDDWHQWDMRLTDSTYNGNLLYVYSFTDAYDGLGVLQFQLYDGESYESQQQPISSWTTPDNYNGKIYLHNTGWQTFGRDITIYGVPESMDGSKWEEGTHALYANFKYGDGEGEWTRQQMTKTKYTYNGNPIYKKSGLFIQYNVIKRVQFLYNDGTDHELYDYTPVSQHVTGDIDGKIFIGWVSSTHTWVDYAPDTYNVELHNDGGRIWADSVGSYTHGESATLPTNITKWGCDFEGWYDNSSLTGDPVTEIADDATGDKDYYAKWTSIAQEYPIASHPEFLAAQEGDIITVNVTGVHTSAAIYLQYPNGTNITNRSLSEAGTYTFQLDAAAAAGIRTNGLLVTGQNFTFSDVDILYRKTIWEGEVDATGNWTQSDRISNDLFAGLQAGDFLGVTVNKINENIDSWHTYAIRAEYRTNIISHDMSDPGVGVDILTEALVDSLQNKTIILVSSYLSCTAIHTYTHTRVYTVEEHTNDGKINADSIGSYTFGTGATLPTDVTRWGYKFAGWYDNEELEGDPVTAISTTDNGDKDYYANWTEISETLLAASGHPEFLAAEEGDILVISVSNTQPRAQIYLQSTDYALCVGSKWIAGTGAGKHVIQLTADGATALHTGVIITGENYTKSSVALLYKKTIWSEGVSDESGWAYKTISDRTGFAGIADGDYLGFTVSDLYEPETNTNQYFMQYNYSGFITSEGLAAIGTYFEVVPSEGADKLTTGKEALTIGAKYLTLSELNRYLTTRDYTVTLNTNGGTINAGNVTSYTYGVGATLPTNVTRTNYTFAGWYDNEELTGFPVTSITTSDLGNKTYYAKWIFIIYRTGDAPDGGIETFAGGTINAPIEYRMKVRELDQWYSLSLPFTVSAVQVIEDGVHYDIVPYYRPTIGGTYYLGHYVIRTPAKTSDFPIKDFGDWRDPNNYDVLPSKNTPYIILWHDSYFYDKYVAFIGAAGQTIPTAMTEGDRPTKDSVVNVYGNDAMISGSVVDAYTFEADYGHGSWLREETIGDSRMIPPFESYLRANAATTPIFKVVRKEDTTTGIDPTSYDPSAHANKVLINGQVVIVKDNKMYNILGMEIQ